MCAKQVRRVIERDGKFYTVRGSELTRASHTMTESEFFSWILSNARRLTLRWKPRNDALVAVRRPYQGPDKRTKWQYQCKLCREWFKQKEVEVDHIVSCQGIKSFDTIANWYKKALVEVDGFRVLCKPCHKMRTKQGGA